MKPACGECGGPLFKSKCYGLCARPRTRRLFGTGPTAREPLSCGYELRWEPRFATAKGLPLNVARWEPYSYTPAGPINVWHRLLARVA